MAHLEFYSNIPLKVLIYLLRKTNFCDNIQNTLKKEKNMENNIKNLKKVTLEEQKQIEESFEKICADVATAALKWANNSSFVLDDAVKDTKNLNALLNEFFYARIFLLLKHCSINIETLEKNILKNTVVRTIDANPTTNFIDFFKNPLNIGYLKLLGKKELLETQDITVAPLEKLLKNI